MKGNCQISNFKFQISICSIALMAALSLSGCMQQPEVTVTIKSVSGGAASSGEATATTETAAAGFGNVSGAVTFEGSPPSLPLFVKKGDAGAKDPAVCAAEDIPDEGIVVGGNKGLANVVIYLDKKPSNIKPELATTPTAPVMFDQKGCRFLPHVLTVRVGQPLLVLSDDPIAHNTHTFPVRATPFNSTISPNERKGIPCNYDKAEAAPIEVKCDLHTWMRAYHFPIDHPYVAITDANGKFKIDGVPAGKQTFKVWHERAKGGFLNRSLVITVKADGDVTQDMNFGGDKFAAVPAPASRGVNYAQLKLGGEIQLTQTEVRP